VIALKLQLDSPWEQARGPLREDLNHLQSALNQRWNTVFGDANALKPGTILGNATAATRYVANTGPGNTLQWDLVNLTNGVIGILPVGKGGTNSAVALSGSTIIIANGTAIVQGAAGTTTTVLHGNAAGAPAYGAVVLTTDVSGILPVANGGSGISTAFTKGSVIFAGVSGVYTQNNASFFWDNTNGRLGIGLGATAPGAILDVMAQVGMNNIYLRNPSSTNQVFISHDNTVCTIGEDPGSNQLFSFGLTGAAQGHVSMNGASISAGYALVLASGFGGIRCDAFTAEAGNPIRLSTETFGEAIRILSASGRVGVQTSVPTALLHINAGSSAASSAPFKLTTGSVLTSPEAGAVEFTTDTFFATITTGPARKGILLDDGSRLTSGTIPVATTNGRLIDSTAAARVASGFASVVAATFEKAETGSDANVLTYTAGATDEGLVVAVATDVSALTGTSVVVTITWKDSNNVTATSSITLSGVGDGTINVPLNAFTATAVVVSTTFVGVSTAYKISAIVLRLK
jgi:hypothetical protein